MNISVRKPKRSEYKRIVVVVNSEFDLYKKVYPKKYLDAVGIGRFSLRDLFEGEKTRKYFVALMGTKIVGFISWYIKPNDVLWISMIQVLPKYYQRSIGRKLFEKVEKYALKNRVIAIAAETQKKAKWVYYFNKSLGYKVLNWKELSKKPFRKTLKNPPVKTTYVWGKILK